MAESIKESKFKIETSALRAYTMIAALALIWMYFHWATGAIFLTHVYTANSQLLATVTYGPPRDATAVALTLTVPNAAKLPSPPGIAVAVSAILKGGSPATNLAP